MTTHELNLEQKKELFEKIEKHIHENVLDSVFYGLGSKLPKQNEIVFAFHYAGQEYNFDNQFGRVVQIRLGCGQFGSNMYLIRKTNGKLITAENVSFRKIPAEFLEEVKKGFLTDESYEDDGILSGYSIYNEYCEVGFIITNSETPASDDSPFSITITKEG